MQHIWGYSLMLTQYLYFTFPMIILHFSTEYEFTMIMDLQKGVSSLYTHQFVKGWVYSCHLDKSRLRSRLSDIQ